jgi:hypothetical protein
MTSMFVILIVALAMRLLPLAALALHLRSCRRYNTLRQEALVTLASRLPPHALIELNDVRGDGRHVRLRIDASTERQAEMDV